MLLQRPGKIICVGRNYVAHARELGNEVPKEPLLFLKAPSVMIPSGAPIVLPAQSRHVEFEGEIAVVIGRLTRRVTEAEAPRCIEGYTCLNDVTARDLQKSDSQWGRAKCFDTFCPAGPVVATGLDWRALTVVTRLNGVERQRGAATEMAFSIPFLVHYISHIMTLERGDLIATGTPAGTAPLSAGDVVEVEIPGVGVLSNPVTAEA
ncbi:MAG: fumarylacetoacetate hydrolase family protein [Gemmatimonadales bacterium]|nr:fumarylacetoacetate hydrolase family protein [Gemmatimonadales bacterium]